MSQLHVHDGATRELLERMIADRQLSALDAQAFAKSGGAATEDAVLLWLAKEYDVPFTALEAIEPDRQVLSLFPARVLLKEQLLPLKRANGAVENRFDLTVNNAPANQVFMALVSGTRYSMLVHPDIKETISVNLKSVTMVYARR